MWNSHQIGNSRMEILETLMAPRLDIPVGSQGKNLKGQKVEPQPFNEGVR